MQANNWSERSEAVTELEKYVASASPQTMSPQLQKVESKTPPLNLEGGGSRRLRRGEGIEKG